MRRRKEGCRKLDHPAPEVEDGRGLKIECIGRIQPATRSFESTAAFVPSRMVKKRHPSSDTLPPATTCPIRNGSGSGCASLGCQCYPMTYRSPRSQTNVTSHPSSLSGFARADPSISITSVVWNLENAAKFFPCWSSPPRLIACRPARTVQARDAPRTFGLDRMQADCSV